MLEKIKYYALWTPAAVIPIGLIVLKTLNSKYQIGVLTIAILLLISLILSLIIFSDNYIKKKNGKKVKDMHFIDAFSTAPDKYKNATGKKDARVPDVDEALTVDGIPSGIIFGKDPQTNKYVAKPVNEAAHFMVCGGSGTGKTQLLLGLSKSISNTRHIAVG